MDILTIRFQTPQDFQKFRKILSEEMVSYNIADLEVVCQCDISQVATAITQFGGMVVKEERG